MTATGGGDNQNSGGSLKIIADLDDWDHSVALNNPGQSGDPASPHYRDLFELWARGKYFPIFYSRSEGRVRDREDVDAAAGCRAEHRAALTENQINRLS